MTHGSKKTSSPEDAEKFVVALKELALGVKDGLIDAVMIAHILELTIKRIPDPAVAVEIKGSEQPELEHIWREAMLPDEQLAALLDDIRLGRLEFILLRRIQRKLFNSSNRRRPFQKEGEQGDPRQAGIAALLREYISTNSPHSSRVPE